MIPGDDEDRKRIARHVKDRENWGFQTVEEGYWLIDALDQFTQNDVVLLDSITAYVQNIIFSDNDVVNDIRSDEIYLHIRSLAHCVKDVVIVSDYIFSDALQYNCETELYRRVLGAVHADIAAESDVVIECAYSNMKFWKNKGQYDFTEILDHYYRLTDHLSYKDI
jgi:adenosylcobinamide kinase/adenosylcobinamide-phosphate guanylyltransferase